MDIGPSVVAAGDGKDAFMANGRVTALALNLRACANGPILGVLRGNCPLRIIGRSGDWLNVTTIQDGAALQGWVFSTYVAQNAVSRAASGAPTPGMLLRTQWQGLLPVISERAAQLIVSCEVTSEAVYTARYLHPEWPQGASGVTIGIGYDIGYVSPDELDADWSGQLAAEDTSNLSPALAV